MAHGEPNRQAEPHQETDQAQALRDLHRTSDPLVLVNAWDVASAVAVVALGGRAIGTSSAGMAASLGIPDAPDAPVDTVFAAISLVHTDKTP